MRRLFAVVIVVALAVSLSGCGGGGEEPAAEGEVAVQTQAPSTAVAPVAATAETSDTLSPGEPQAFEPFPDAEEALPDVIKQRIEADRPMLVFFYDASQKTTDDQRKAIDAVLADYRGLIDLVSFDASKYVTIDETGTVSVKPGMMDDVVAQQVARLMSSDHLDIGFTPYLVFVDRQGYITYRYRGYVDESAIEREVLRATE